MGMADRVSVFHHGVILRRPPIGDSEHPRVLEVSFSRHEPAGQKTAAPLVTVEGLHTYTVKSHILHGRVATSPRQSWACWAATAFGKSTTLKTIMGLVRAGRAVLLDGEL